MARKKSNGITRRDFIKSTTAGALAAGIAPCVLVGESEQAAKTGSKSIKALAFDAYGTLFDVHSVVSALNEKFPGRGTEISNAWRLRQLQYTWLRALMGRYEDFWKVTEVALEAACKSLKLSCDPGTRAALMEGYLHLDAFPEVKEALKSLSAYRLAILSNGTPRMLQAAVESAGLKGMFAQVISVDEIKTYKPKPEVYQLAPQKFRVEKASIGFISSNFWDAVGAKSFGLRAFWVNRTGSPAEELGLAPDATVNTLTELAGVLET